MMKCQMSTPSKPAHISHTHCQAAQASRTNPSLSKSVSEPTHSQKKKKHESTTLAIRNAGESADIKAIT